jgi:hypothetical protein
MWRDLNDGDKQEFIIEYENAKVREFYFGYHLVIFKNCLI